MSKCARRSTRCRTAKCVTDQILNELLPARTHRANPRVVKPKMSVYQVKHPRHRNAPRIDREPLILQAE